MRVNAKLAAAVGCLAAGFAPSAAVADITLPFDPPPTPQNTFVEVAEGGRVDITLRLTGAPRGRTLDFIIRTPPTKGRLDPVRSSIGGDSATVTYTHNPANGGGHDQFTFAVQRTAGGVSATGMVDIRIPENPPRLIALPAILEFGPAPVGGPGARQTFVLMNGGGGTATGRIILQPPWRVDGEASYALRRGQRKSFQFIFEPTRASAFEGEVRFGSGSDQVLRLFGSGLEANVPNRTGRPMNPPALKPTPTPRSTAAEPEGSDLSPTATPAGTARDAAESDGAVQTTPGPSPATAGNEDFDAGLLAPNYPGGEFPLADAAVEVLPDGRAALSWKGVDPPAGSVIRVEERELFFEANHRLAVRWVLVPSPLAGRRGERMEITVRPARSASMHTYRAALFDASGSRRGFSAFVHAQTPRGSWLDFFTLGRTSLLLLLLAVAAIGVREWRR